MRNNLPDAPIIQELLNLKQSYCIKPASLEHSNILIANVITYKLIAEISQSTYYQDINSSLIAKIYSYNLRNYEPGS